MPDARFVFWLGRIRKALVREFETRARGFEITVPQFMVLRRLSEGDGMPTSVLAGEVGSDGATLTGVLDRLEARGLIRRERCLEDRRAVRIHITPAGRTLLEPLQEVVSQVNSHALEALSDGEKEELVRLLDRVGGSLGA
jgi:DNA-binding MarR family transcriptional regulator